MEAKKTSRNRQEHERKAKSSKKSSSNHAEQIINNSHKQADPQPKSTTSLNSSRGTKTERKSQVAPVTSKPVDPPPLNLSEASTKIDPTNGSNVNNRNCHSPTNKKSTPTRDKSFSSNYSDGEEDFEDYSDEDFEDEDPSSPQYKPKQPSSTVETKNSNGQPVKPKPKPMQMATGKFSKVSSYINNNSTLSKSNKNSAVLSSFNPQAKRIAKVKSVIRLTTVSFTPYSQAPITKYKHYQARLRLDTNSNNISTASINESTTQFNDNNRIIGTQSEEVATSEKETLCRNGEDDTQFEKILRCCQERDLHGLRNILPRRNAEERRGETTNDLNEFFEQAGRLCESLAEENLARAGESVGEKATHSRVIKEDGGLFARGSEWKELGSAKNPFNKALKDHLRVTQILTSSKGTIVATVHVNKNEKTNVEGGGGGDRRNIFEGKSVICIWETFNTAIAAKILVCDGTITTCCLGSLNHIVVAGKDDGGICLWDLIESKGMHIGQLSILLNMANLPVRLPTYSTDYQSLGDFAHASPIVSVVINVNQLVSVDDRGMSTVWYVNVNQNNEGIGSSGSSGGDGFGEGGWGIGFESNDHLGLGVSADLKLVPSRVFWFTKNGLVDAKEDPTIQAGMGIGPIVSGFYSCLANLAGNEFVVGMRDGSLWSCRLFGRAVKQYSNNGERGGGVESEIISVSMNSFVNGIFLVGRKNGQVELFKIGVESVIATYDCNFKYGVDGGSQSGRLLSVEWSPHKVGMFFVTCHKYIFVVDMHKNEFGCVQSYTMEDGRGGAGGSAISKGGLNVVGNVFFASICETGAYLREINKNILKIEGNSLHEDIAWFKRACGLTKPILHK
ncbi:hypothetical protein ScalyP_jg10746 [Parmales sp. scaly parma]|nr:hypothetical protein ScalyP_jg10746 [Parmales sp. scaly parma]